jgi:prepilin-type N-terminal cleavage/methylation domain-containing protein
MRGKARGFTLIEMMMTSAIVGIIVLVGAAFFTQVFRFFRMNQARAYIQRDARAVFDLISRNARQAEASSIVVDSLTGQPPYSRVSFTRKDGLNMSFYQSGAQIYQVVGGTKSICDNVRFFSLSFPRSDDDNLLSMSLTLEKATYNSQTKALQLSVEKIKVHND